MKKYIILFFLSIGFHNSARASTILVFGDSLSAGYGLPSGKSWVDLLKKRLEGTPYTIVNASVSGETTSGGLGRIGPLLEKYKPEIVILELGANDGLRGEPLEVMRKNLEAMISSCRDSGSKVLLVGMRLPPNYGVKYSDTFRKIYPDLAKKYDLRIVPFMLEGFAERTQYFQPDGLHPAQNAQPMVLSNIWKPLSPMLSKARR